MDGKYILEELYTVDEDKLIALDDKTLLKLVETGIYKLATIQLLSYYNLDKLVALKEVKG